MGDHVSGPVGRTGGPKKKSFQGGTFETGGFNICLTSKNVNTPFKKVLREVIIMLLYFGPEAGPGG